MFFDDSGELFIHEVDAKHEKIICNIYDSDRESVLGTLTMQRQSTCISLRDGKINETFNNPIDAILWVHQQKFIIENVVSVEKKE